MKDIIDIREFDNSKGGLLLPGILARFMDGFNENHFMDFKKIISESNVTKWFIHSDYVLHDKKKPNNVITFSLIPHIFNYKEFLVFLKYLNSKDLKKRKKIPEEFLTFISSVPIINISLIFEKKYFLFLEDEKEMFIIKIKALVLLIDTWIEEEFNNKSSSTSLENLKNLTKDKKDLNILINELNKKSFNIQLLKDIEIVAFMVSLIGFNLNKSIKLEKIGWFSDRDKLISFCESKFSNPIIFTLIQCYHHLFCSEYEINKYSSINFGVPQENTDVFYDSLNRIPDMVAGTLADINFKTNEISHDKFIPVLENYLTIKEKNFIFRISTNPLTIEKVIIDKKNKL